MTDTFLVSTHTEGKQETHQLLPEGSHMSALSLKDVVMQRQMKRKAVESKIFQTNTTDKGATYICR
jgi:hypothetical protein